MRTIRPSLLSLAVLAALSFAPRAQAAAFSDVPPGHAAYDAVEYLKAQGIVSGYDDGTFRPDQKVNRAEALKLIVAPIATRGQLNGYTTSSYDDVAKGAWFLPYVEWARQRMGLIDGPPNATAFNPSRNVTKIEFLKMFLLSQEVDAAGAFGEIKLPLATDVTDTGQWYYPYMRYAITASMTLVSQQGTLNPAQALNRGQIAMMMYRFFLYEDGERTQALVNEVDSEISNVARSLQKNDITQAEYASARALLAARGALEAAPNEPLVKGTVKAAEAFRLIVRAYRAGISQKFQEAIDLSKQAWDLGNAARGFSSHLHANADQIQTFAKSIADEARKWVK